ERDQVFGEGLSRLAHQYSNQDIVVVRGVDHAGFGVTKGMLGKRYEESIVSTPFRIPQISDSHYSKILNDPTWLDTSEARELLTEELAYQALFSSNCTTVYTLDPARGNALAQVVVRLLHSLSQDQIDALMREM